MIQVTPPNVGVTVFTAPMPGIYCLYAEHVSGGPSRLRSSHIPRNVAYVCAGGALYRGVVYLGALDTITALSTAGPSTINIALARIGDELFPE